MTLIERSFWETLKDDEDSVSEPALKCPYLFFSSIEYLVLVSTLLTLSGIHLGTGLGRSLPYSSGLQRRGQDIPRHQGDKWLHHRIRRLLSLPCYSNDNQCTSTRTVPLDQDTAIYRSPYQSQLFRCTASVRRRRGHRQK